MDLETLKASLEQAGKTKEMEAVVALIEAEKSKGITESSKRNIENSKLRKFKTAMEALGYADGDLDEFVANSIKKSSTPPSDSLTLKALNDKLANVTTQLDTERTARQSAEGMAKNKSISAKLTSVLTDKVYGADLLIQSLISSKQVDLEGDKVVFIDGENRLDFDTGMTALLESRKDIAKTVQTPGTGKVPTKTIPTNIDAITQSGDREAIMANMDQVKEAYGIKK